MSSIDFFFEDVVPILIHKKILILHLNSLIKNELKKAGDISVIFCSDEYLLKMNKEYLNHDYYTDIITFDYVEEDVISGDLFISIERIIENAGIYDSEALKELFRVVFHGVLHLIGYNDKTKEEQKLMREKEDYYLSEVDFKEMKL
jgi:rRNA maturation RNase YbeY